MRHGLTGGSQPATVTGIPHGGPLPLLRACVRLLLALVVTLGAGQEAFAQPPAERWTRALADFDALDRATPPLQGEVLFLGSSTIVNWDLARAFPGIKSINRGVWSSSLFDQAQRIDRLVLPYAPRLIVIYAGDNDLNGGATSEQVAVAFEQFVMGVQAKLPQTRIVFIGLKPSPQRWSQIQRYRAANSLIREYCGHDDRLAFVDVDGPMLGWDEKPRKELYVEDGLHLSQQGYALWNVLLRPFLVP
jgi:lysophospholipase L1-like esterase